MTRRRVAVVGDVGGHVVPLRAELRRLGADPQTGRLPEDLVVVQIGDLVHRGPSSDAVVALVDHYLTDQPGQWIQLVGNHEAQYLRDPAFTWPERIGADTVATLRRWWADGQMVAATSLSTGAETFLLTHAGLTSGFWREVLAAPETAQQAARAVNALIAGGDERLFRPGQMLQGRRVDHAAGPLWASAAGELVPSWSGRALPFSQVHGHSSIVSWDLAATHHGVGADARVARLDGIEVIVDLDAKHEMACLPGGRIIGIDPDHGSRAQESWHSWEAQAVVTDADPTPGIG